MDAVVDFLRRLPDEISRVGGSLAWRAGLLALAVLLNIGFYLPSLPQGTPGAGVPGVDKVVHLLVFALTVFAAGRLLAPRRRFPMGWVVIVAVVHAVLIELVQLVALPQRSGDGVDILFDVIGIALGVGLWIGERVRRDRQDLAQEQDHAQEPTAAADPRAEPGIRAESEPVAEHRR